MIAANFGDMTSVSDIWVGGPLLRESLFLSAFFLSFFDKFLCSPVCPQTCCVAENDLELLTALLPLPPKRWDFRCVAHAGFM